MTTTIPKRTCVQKVFTYRPGTDGTESTFDVVYMPTNTVIAAAPYWEAAAEAKRDAQRLVRILNAFYNAGGYVYPEHWAEVGRLINGSSHWQVTNLDPTPAAAKPARPLPPDPEEMNDRRSAWAGQALSAFRRATNVELEDSLGDLLADFMHWSDRHNFDFEAAMDRAHFHYDAETSEGGEA